GDGVHRTARQPDAAGGGGAAAGAARRAQLRAGDGPVDGTDDRVRGGAARAGAAADRPDWGVLDARGQPAEPSGRHRTLRRAAGAGLGGSVGGRAREIGRASGREGGGGSGGPRWVTQSGG